MSALLLGLASSNNASKNYVDDVFSAYTYTGNGGTQTINNGIDLSGKGGMVWMKCRSFTYGHGLVDTVRTRSKVLVSNTTSAEASSGSSFDLTSFNSNGFTVGDAQNLATNVSGHTFASWTFRKAPKFFDVITWTGDGVDGRVLSHSLGSVPGMMVVKKTSAADDWYVYHRSGGDGTNTGLGVLNLTNAFDTGATTFGGPGNVSVFPTSTTFTIRNSFNTSGATYVVYLFAHDTSSDGMIQCGSFNENGVNNVTINLGYEPQYVMFKSADAASPWYVCDSMRGIPTPLSAGATGNYISTVLQANTSGAEAASNAISLNSTGFTFYADGRLTNTAKWIYMAIRRPNKPPTGGTQVYNAIARTGTFADTVVSVGFPVDMLISNRRIAPSFWVLDRLRGSTASSGNQAIQTWSTSAEANTPGLWLNGSSVGYNLNANNTFNASSGTYVEHVFKRATGFFDVVCYTGTGAAKTESHSLGVVPEFMIVKYRSAAGYDWLTYHKGLNGGTTPEQWWIKINGASTQFSNSTYWNNTAPTSSLFTIGTASDVNASAGTYVAYLFASLAGISKVGNYTGNGSTQTINCGFAAGARFVLIKRTDASGDWYVWDTARGIITANDPHLSLNSAAGEVTSDDSIDPDSTGFIVNQLSATNVNVTSATYIFLAIA